MVDHGLSMLVTSDALNLAGANLTHHSTDSLSDGSLKHLVEFTNIQAHLIDVVTILVDVQNN